MFLFSPCNHRHPNNTFPTTQPHLLLLLLLLLVLTITVTDTATTSRWRDDVTSIPGLAVGQSASSHWSRGWPGPGQGQAQGRGQGAGGRARGPTGVTAVLCPGGCGAAVAQVGGAPCTSQTDAVGGGSVGLTSVCGVALTGGSIRGIYGSSAGVTECVANESITRFPGKLVYDEFHLPQIPSAALLDLRYVQLRNPNASQHQGLLYSDYFKVGWEACTDALATHSKGSILQGSHGAGAGAVVGHYCTNFSNTMKGGIGSSAKEYDNGAFVGTVVAVNAYGAIRNQKGEFMAGCLKEGGGILDPVEQLEAELNQTESYGHLTVIGVVVTNVELPKVYLKKLAQAAVFGLSDAVIPTATSFDGDTIFALSTETFTGDSRPHLTLLEGAARESMALSVRRAVCCTASDPVLSVASAVSPELCKQVWETFEHPGNCDAYRDYLQGPQSLSELCQVECIHGSVETTNTAANCSPL
ncbi:P1 family peptidase [Pelomyxa schiedti]|nr:P1 family peptidase [Pelomyxa schiedti]